VVDPREAQVLEGEVTQPFHGLVDLDLAPLDLFQ